jgi:hypothetical protein
MIFTADYPALARAHANTDSASAMTRDYKAVVDAIAKENVFRLSSRRSGRSAGLKTRLL